MADDLFKSFSGFPNVERGREQVEAFSQYQAEQQEAMRRAGETISRARAEAERRDEDRDALQLELVELQRSTAQREVERDRADAAREVAQKAADDRRDADERKRRRRELYRWCFTTALALAGITIAIVGLATR